MVSRAFMGGLIVGVLAAFTMDGVAVIALRPIIAGRSSDGFFTVNSSLSAVPVYQAFDFVRAGSKQRMHGISFLPMRRRLC